MNLLRLKAVGGEWIWIRPEHIAAFGGGEPDTTLCTLWLAGSDAAYFKCVLHTPNQIIAALRKLSGAPQPIVIDVDVTEMQR